METGRERNKTERGRSERRVPGRNSRLEGLRVALVFGGCGPYEL